MQSKTGELSLRLVDSLPLISVNDKNSVAEIKVCLEK